VSKKQKKRTRSESEQILEERLEQESAERLGEKVCHVVPRRDIAENKRTSRDLLSHEVITHVDVLRAVVGSAHLNASLIVFPHDSRAERSKTE
jgi:hypothetical protein